MPAWLKLHCYPDSQVTLVNMDNVAYLSECSQQDETFTDIVFCAKGTHALQHCVREAVDEIAKKLDAQGRKLHE